MLENETTDHRYVLRRSIAPYVVFAIPMLFVTALGAYASIVTARWSSFAYFIMPWVLLVPWALLQSRYSVGFTDSEIFGRAAGVKSITVGMDLIKQVRLETASIPSLLSLRRPFRRIAIYTGEGDGVGNYIDVSLKHFVPEDIRMLMRAIQRRRPDLVLPTKWL